VTDIGSHLLPRWEKFVSSRPPINAPPCPQFLQTLNGKTEFESSGGIDGVKVNK
jgi:hypothetical protein